jgi:hypothetical protein
MPDNHSRQRSTGLGYQLGRLPQMLFSIIVAIIAARAVQGHWPALFPFFPFSLVLERGASALVHKNSLPHALLPHCLLTMDAWRLGPSDAGMLANSCATLVPISEDSSGMHSD